MRREKKEKQRRTLVGEGTSKHLMKEKRNQIRDSHFLKMRLPMVIETRKEK